MTSNTNTYEFTAFTEDDLASDGNLSCGDVFTMPGASTVCFTVTDNDSRLSGDSCRNENSNDGSGQTASIIDAETGEELGNGRQIYGESYFWVQDQDGTWYVLIEIEQEGTGDDYFTFYTGGNYSVPPEGAVLTVKGQCNITDWEPDFKCLDAGEKIELGTIKGTVWCDLDCDGDQDISTTVSKGDNLLKDGDFEAGTTIYNIGNYGAWYDAGNDSGDIIQGTAANHCGNAADNEIWELDKGSILCQVFQAPADGKYCLTFDVYDNKCLGKYDDKFKVKINGQTVETVKVTEDGSVTITLDLSAGENRLDFVSLSKVSGRGPGIDNIELRQEITETASEPVKEGVTIKLLADLDNDGEIDDVVATTTTDENGNYRFDDVEAGNYKIMGVAPDGTEFTIQDAPGAGDDADSDVDQNGMSGVITLNAGDTADVDLGLKEVKVGALSGRYFCDENGNDVDDGEVGVPGIATLLVDDGTGNLVRAKDNDGNDVADFMMGADGEYRFDNLAAGDYVVQFSQPEEGKAFVTPNVGDTGGTDAANDSDVIDPATGTTAPVTVVAGEETTDVDAGIVLLGSLGGRYFCDENDDDVDNDEPGIGGVTVTLLADLDNDGQVDDVLATETTNEDGEYLFTGLRAGTYRVLFDADPTGKTFVAQDDPGGNGAGDDTDDSDVDQNGLTDVIALGVGEHKRDVDAGVEDPNTPPEPKPDLAELCIGDIVTTVNLALNDIDADGDALSVTGIKDDDEDVGVGGTITLASGATATLNGDGTVTIDASSVTDPALLDLLVRDVDGPDPSISEALFVPDSFQYTVTDGTDAAMGSVGISYKGTKNTLETIEAALPTGTGSFTLAFTNDGNGIPFPDLYEVTLTDNVAETPEAGDNLNIDGTLDLDGFFERAFCANADLPTDFNMPIEVDFLLFDEDTAGIGSFVEDPSGIGIFNWILNQEYKGLTTDTFTEAEEQWAMWLAVNDDPINVDAPAFFNAFGGDLAGAEALYQLALGAGTAASEFEAGEGDLVGILLAPVETTPLELSQPFVVGVEYDTLMLDCVCLDMD